MDIKSCDIRFLFVFDKIEMFDGSLDNLAKAPDFCLFSNVSHRFES
jgi:hypothetical protein